MGETPPGMPGGLRVGRRLGRPRRPRGLVDGRPLRPPLGGHAAPARQRPAGGAAHLARGDTAPRRHRGAGPRGASSCCSGCSSSSCRGAAKPHRSSTWPAAIPRSRWRSTAPNGPTTWQGRSPTRRWSFYREAWAEIVRARNTGLAAPALDDLERRVRPAWTAVPRAHAGHRSGSPTCLAEADPVGLARGPTGRRRTTSTGPPRP